MIQFSLKCSKGHKFDSWFQSGEAYGALEKSGMLSCAVCGSPEVTKAPMAPRVAAGADEAPPPEAAPERPLSAPASAAEQAMSELRRKIEENSDYVGSDFVREARAMHEGEAPGRSIHGEARLDEARKLAEDGVPVMPLPFLPTRKAN